MISPILILMSVLGLSSVTRPDEAVPKAATKAKLEPDVPDISGYYTCKGAENGGKTYSGVAVISKKNDIYVVQWMVGSTSTFTGVGIRQGATFSASWALGGDKGIIRGVNVYKIEPGPRLIGRWATLPGNGVVQNETLTFLKHIEEED